MVLLINRGVRNKEEKEERKQKKASFFFPSREKMNVGFSFLSDTLLSIFFFFLFLLFFCLISCWLMN